MKKVLMLVMVLCSALAGVATKADVFYEVWNGVPPAASAGTQPLLSLNDWANMPAPAGTGVLPNFSMGPRAGTDSFTFRQTAYVYVPATAEYTFYVDSDDGGIVFVDGVIVAQWDGWHGMDGGDGMTEGPVSLTAGLHIIEAQMYEDGGGEGLEVRVESADIGLSRRLIPDNYLWASPEAKLDSGNIIYPAQAIAVNPVHTAIDVPLTGTVLEWAGGVAASGYNVYFADSFKAANEPNSLIGTVSGNTASLDTLYGPLKGDTTYWFRVDAIAEPNDVIGIAFEFTSEPRKPIFSIQPQTLLVGEGGWDGQLTAAAASPQGEAVTLAWYKEGNVTSIGSGNTLNITGIDDAKSGNYYCVATNIFGDTKSNVVSVSILKYGDLQLLGLEAYWPMDNGYSDMSGKGHHAVKGHTWTVADIVSDAVVGKAVSFGGTWGHALQAGTWNPSAVTGKLTVSHWVKWRGGGDTWQGTIGKRLTWNGTSTMWQFELTINNSPGYSDWKREGSYPGGGFDMPINQWTLVTITCDGSTAITYRDGVENGRGGFTFGPMTNAPVWIGACDGELLNGGGNPWNGLEDEVAIWDRVLTPAEVAQLYNGGNGIPLGGYWTVPSPISPDGSSLVNPDVDLSLVWNYGPYAPKGATYKVILSKDAAVAANPATPASYTVVNVNLATVPASVLNTDEKWYWRVDTVYNSRTESSGVFSFETIKTFPVPVTQPADVLVGQGETANYSFVVNSDSTVTYKWYKVGNPTALSTKVGDNTFAVTGVTPASEGYYYCIATNNAGPTQSNNARLWLKQLIAYWPMDAIQPANPVDPNDRPKVLDVVGGHTGIVNGGAGPTVVAGRAGSAVQFDGGNDYVAVGAVGIYNQMPRTISVWVKSTFAQAPTDFINVFGFTSTPDGWCDGSFDINANIFNNQQYGLHTYCWERALAPTDTEWRNFVGTYDGSTIAWYTDGEPVGTDTRVLWTQDNVQMAHRGHDGKYFPGAIDEARIYNYALSPVQVARLYYDVTGEAACSQYPAVDYNRDCKVTLADFAIFVENWGQCNIVPDCLP